MRHRAMYAVLSLLFLGITGGTAFAASAETVRTGKACTGIVDLGDGGGSATCFCIHPSGYFVTNQHAVQGVSPGEEVAFVLNCGEPSQKVGKLRMVRSDPETDLALLQAAGSGRYNALTLGRSHGLLETQEVTAFGYPFGKALGEGNGGYPAISVSVGRINAIRKRRGKVHRIQLDAVLNPGNSGGPVLNERGEVVGIVVSGVVGTGVNFAIPVDQLKEFLNAPLINIKPRKIEKGDLRKQMRVEAELVRFPWHTGNITLELNVGPEDAQRQYLFREVGASYTVDFIPIPSRGNGSQVDAVLFFSAGQIRALADDVTVKHKDGAYPLHKLREVVLGEEPSLTTEDGAVLKGQVDLPERLKIDLGEIQPRIALSKCKRIRILPPSDHPEVPYRIVARSDGERLATVEGILQEGQALESVTPGDRAGALAAATDGSQGLATLKENTVVKLPAPITDCVAASGGARLVLYLRKIRKLAIVHTGTAKIERYIDLAGDNILFTAGQKHVVVVLVDQRLIQKYDILTGKRSKTVTLPIPGVPKNICMGCASEGPILLHWAKGTSALDRGAFDLIDLETFKPIHLRKRGRTHNGTSFRDRIHMRASSDGTVFGMWCTSHSPQGLEALVLEGRSFEAYYDHKSVGHVVPGPDGQFLYTCKGIYTQKVKAVQQDLGRDWQGFIPAKQGNFFLGIVHADPQRRGVLMSLYVRGQSTPIATVLEHTMIGAIDQWAKGTFTFDRRIHFVPATKCIAVIPHENDRVILNQFDIEATLAKTDQEYMFVLSSPPRSAKSGSQYTYQIRCVSKNGGIQYKLESGPQGLRLSPNGKVTWRVPSVSSAQEAPVVVLVRDAKGKEVFHTFTIRIVR